LTPTTEVVASPAMAQVAPGGRQLVRIVRRGAPLQHEQAYRLRVEELPRPDRLRDENGPALQLLLSYLLPVFLGPEGVDEIPNLSAALGPKTLQLTNPGKKRVMVSDLRAVD